MMIGGRFVLSEPGTTRDETLRRYSNSVSHRLPTVRTVKPRALLTRHLPGTVTDVAFSDAQKLLVALGFDELRVRGSHHVYGRPGLPEQINLQDRRGQAKPLLELGGPTAEVAIAYRVKER